MSGYRFRLVLSCDLLTLGSSLIPNIIWKLRSPKRLNRLVLRTGHEASILAVLSHHRRRNDSGTDTIPTPGAASVRIIRLATASTFLREDSEINILATSVSLSSNSSRLHLLCPTIAAIWMHSHAIG